MFAPVSLNWALTSWMSRWNEHVFPRDEDIAQDDRAVRLVESRGERMIGRPDEPAARYGWRG